MAIGMKRTVTQPRCGKCGALMVFFDQAWAETRTVLVASVICTDPNCLNADVIYVELVWKGK